MNQRRQPPAPRVRRYCSHVTGTTWNRSQHGGGAAGIKPSAEVKATPDRFLPLRLKNSPRRRKKKKTGKIKTLASGGGARRITKMSRFSTIWSGKLTKYERGVMFL